MIYRAVGTWTGSGHAQSDSFAGASGAYRVTWDTRHTDGRHGPGKFRLTLNSAISGRELSVVVEQEGAGSNVAYVTTEPRVVYFAVEAQGLEWSFTADEQFTA